MSEFQKGSTDPNSPYFDPNAFLASLVFDAPDAPLDMPSPPLLGEDEVVTVRRVVEFDPSVDATLRATAAARGISVEQLIQERARHAA